jgi:hypothetical protein
MSKQNLHRKLVNCVVVSALLYLILGPGCGSAADFDAKSCCRDSTLCQHRGDESKDPEKCCQKGKQSKPSVNAHLSESSLTKKVFDLVLLDASPFATWFDSIVLKDYQVPPPRIFKPPQQDLYKLTSTFLI